MITIKIELEEGDVKTAPISRIRSKSYENRQRIDRLHNNIITIQENHSFSLFTLKEEDETVF